MVSRFGTKVSSKWLPVLFSSADDNAVRAAAAASPVSPDPISFARHSMPTVHRCVFPVWGSMASLHSIRGLAQGSAIAGDPIMATVPRDSTLPSQGLTSDDACGSTLASCGSIFWSTFRSVLFTACVIWTSVSGDLKMDTGTETLL